MTLPAYTGVLTPAHRQIVTDIRDHWAAAVLSTAPVDRAAAAEAVRRLYENNKLRQPAMTIWMDSPLGCIYAAAVVGQLGEQLRKQFVTRLTRHQLERQLGWRLWRALAGQLREQLGDQLGARLRGRSAASSRTSSAASFGASSAASSGASCAGRSRASSMTSSGISSGAGFGTSSGTSSGASSGSSWVPGVSERDEDWDWDETDGWDEAEHSALGLPVERRLRAGLRRLRAAHRRPPADPRLDALSKVVTRPGG